MAQATLTIDLSAIRTNWRALAKRAGTVTGAVVKADAYGLGVAPVAKALLEEGARAFFVAQAEEGQALRTAIGPGPEIFVFSGHMAGDAAIIRQNALIPLLNSVDQALRHFEALPGHDFGIQLDTGMNRLGLEAVEWAALRDIVLPQGPKLVMSHLACADEPSHRMNAFQLRMFREMTRGCETRLSLSATGGLLLGPEFSFDMVRPGIGLYGGLPFLDAMPVVKLDIPVIQTRSLETGESVGYGNSWVARTNSKIATISAGYADGLIRAIGPAASVWAGERRCKIVGRVSMDLIGIDVTPLTEIPETVEILGQHQSIDSLANCAGTIGYEILTALGPRYSRKYVGQ